MQNSTIETTKTAALVITDDIGSIVYVQVGDTVFAPRISGDQLVDGVFDQVLDAGHLRNYREQLEGAWGAARVVHPDVVIEGVFNRIPDNIVETVSPAEALASRIATNLVQLDRTTVHVAQWALMIGLVNDLFGSDVRRSVERIGTDVAGRFGLDDAPDRRTVVSMLLEVLAG